MTKLVPLLSAVSASLCLLAARSIGLAQQAQPARPSGNATPAAIAVANPGPTPASVETPAADNQVEDGSAPAAETEILASEGATFAAKDRVAVFSGDVRVRDPRFTLACEKLTVYLAKGNGPDATSPVPPATPRAAENADPANRGGGIDHAVAEGHVIIIQKRAPTKPGEEEKISIGRSDTAEFDNKTGDMTLRGTPRVEQNGNRHEALSKSTVMILHRDNSLETHGPSRTIIIQRAKDTEAPGTRPGASPTPRRTQTGNTQG